MGVQPFVGQSERFFLGLEWSEGDAGRVREEKREVSGCYLL